MDEIPEWVKRRAGGRRRYNKRRQMAAFRRSVIVLYLYVCRAIDQAEIARMLGVDRSTVCRDLQSFENTQIDWDLAEDARFEVFYDKAEKWTSIPSKRRR